MTNNKNCLTNFEVIESEKIMVANGQYMVIKGKGKIVLKMEVNGNRRNLQINELLYVPELERNLLSVSKMTKEGYKVNFSKKNCYIKKGDIEVATAKHEKGLHKIEVYGEEVNSVTASCETISNCIHIWHRRLGHRNPESIKDLVKRKRADGIEINECKNIKQCVSCIEIKLRRKSFPKVSSSRSKEVLDLIHSDLCGPMRTPTVGKKKYFLTFTDDFSRYTTVYLLETKDEVLPKLKDFLTEMKYQFGRVSKCLRSDNGKEYIAREVQDLLRTLGIKVQSTVPYCPEQNEVSERKNRTLVEPARCMLNDAKLPYEYWGEAVMTANYITNRMITKATDKTPYEAWTGKRPNLEHMVTFGSQSFIFIPKEKRTKLEKKAKEGIMLGYSDTSKGYRILDPSTKQITISQNR